MTNDDRSNQDRTGDGQAPSWGESPQQPAAEAPRYGERSDSTPQYGQSAPQYGEQQQYGQQPQYEQQQYAAAPANSGSPAWQSYEEPKAKKKTVGVVAFVLGVVALVLGVIAGYVFGTTLVNSSVFDQMVQNGGSTTPDQSEMNALAGDPGFLVGGLLFGVGTLLGLWAIVQGIIAAVTKRGRGWGVFGLVLAVLGPIAVFVAYVAVAGAAAAGSMS